MASGPAVVRVRLAIKVLELIISCICIALHAHSVFEKYSESILLPIVYGGYVIILAGLILGYVTKERAPKKVDLLYTAAAVPLFVAAGAVGVHFYHNTGYRFRFGNITINTGLACGSLGIINAGFFLLDAVLGVMDNTDMAPRV
ncbi:uncharacterized protein LOC134537726 [Bacillus rossius redtenbacheri]|uniref:uncharacterized protein LOC134537726 n=1 Tax=Bacillus rossius redtenbacheri TaxID=93214 RepID=UPI002FDEAFAD